MKKITISDTKSELEKTQKSGLEYKNNMIRKFFFEKISKKKHRTCFHLDMSSMSGIFISVSVP